MIQQMTNNETCELFDLAKIYFKKGLSIIPIPAREKKAKIKWKKYCSSYPTIEELENWFKSKSPEQIGCAVVFSASNLAALDIENTNIYWLFFKKPPEELAKETWVAKTGKGYHVYFDISGMNFQPVEARGLVEFRCGNQYCILPPSIHPSGQQYEWVGDVNSTDIAKVDEKTIRYIYEKIQILASQTAWIREFAENIVDGRHDAYLHLSGLMRKEGVPREDARMFIRTIILLQQDPGENDRLRSLDAAYDTDNLETLGGKSSLAKVLEEIYPDGGKKLAHKIASSLGREYNKKDGNGGISFDELLERIEKVEIVGGEESVVKVITKEKVLVFSGENFMSLKKWKTKVMSTYKKILRGGRGVQAEFELFLEELMEKAEIVGELESQKVRVSKAVLSELLRHPIANDEKDFARVEWGRLELGNGKYLVKETLVLKMIKEYNSQITVADFINSFEHGRIISKTIRLQGEDIEVIEIRDEKSRTEEDD